MRKDVLCVAVVACLSFGCSSGSGSSASGAPASSTAASTGTGAVPPATAAATTTATTPPATTGTSQAGSASGGGIAGPATEEGAKAIVTLLQKAPDPSVEAHKLRPGMAELNALFSDPEVSTAVAEQLEKALQKPTKKDFPDGEPFVFCAKSDDVKAWTDPVKKNFPGGYKRLTDKLNNGITMCKFKIGGIAFDSLVNIDGKWFIVPKPFRAVKR